MGYWICYDLSLVVVEGGVAGRSGLADYRVAYSVEGDAIVVGPLDMNRCARARVVIGNVDVGSVRCDPGAVSLGSVDDLGCTVSEVASKVRVRTSNGRYSKLGDLGLWVEEGQQSRRMQSAR